ncbi:hypothetical protein PV325_011379 [Microctonus aethiopoides]|nr:hypothetical protein PV325_011379 [Microctonus aethiopoides]
MNNVITKLHQEFQAKQLKNEDETFLDVLNNVVSRRIPLSCGAPIAALADAVVAIVSGENRSIDRVNPIEDSVSRASISEG